MIAELVSNDGKALTFSISDRLFPLTFAAWERLRGWAPVPATSEDQTDFAIGMVEAWAKEAIGFSDADLVDRFGELEPTSPEAELLAAEIERRGLDV